MDQKICCLFNEYDDVMAAIAVIEYKIENENLSPSMAGADLLELSMNLWELRRKIQYTMSKQPKPKSVLRRIFSK